MADTKKSGFFSRIRGHAEWEMVKVVYRWGSPMIYALSAALYQKLRHLDRDWLVIGLLFGLGVVSSFIGYLLNRPQVRKSEHEPPNSQSPPDAIGQREVRVLETLFTPLQIEAFSLAKELGDFRGTLGTKGNYERLMSEQEKLMVLNKNAAENRKLSNSYSLRFAGKVKELMHRFEELGINSNQLMHFTGSIADERQIPTLQSNLVRLAHLVDGVELK
jgi:hypothetical protein